MGVPTTLRGISGTANNNSPAGTDVVGTSADDYIRGVQAVVRQYLAGQSSTVAPSAGVADLTTATGHWVPVSGSSTITGLGSEDAGIEYILTFTGAPILVNSSSLALPGAATVQAATADVCVAESLGSGNWRLWGYQKASIPPNGTKSPVRTVYTSGSGTHVPTVGVSYMDVQLVGGGGGGAAATSNAGTVGGSTTFGGSLTAGGGSGGAVGGAGGAGGTASGGDINIPGGAGSGGVNNAAGSAVVMGGSPGGNGFFGGGGAAGVGNGPGGTAATNSGGGGGGAGNTGATTSGGGGGAGGYVRKLITAPSATYAYSVGAAGSGGSAGGNAGGSGAAGIIIVDEYFG